jgi:hypothetical protein
MDVWAYREQHPEENRMFNDAMKALSQAAQVQELAAYNFSRHHIIADIGGGTGALLASILQKYPDARGILFDQPHVAAAASTTFQQTGVSDRVRIEPGSFFEYVPAGADAYIMRHILHDWPDVEAAAILGRCRAAMQADASLLLIDSVVGPPNRDPHSKFLDLVMLVSAGGYERTEQEWRILLADGGFRLRQVHPAGPASSVIEAVPA